MTQENQNTSNTPTAKALPSSSGSSPDDCLDPNAKCGMGQWMSRYKIVGRKTPRELETAVGQLIDHGFIPLGGLCVFREYKDGQIYAQAMLKG